MSEKASGINFQRRGGAGTLGRSVSWITKPIFGKRGLADGVIVKDWAEIAGSDLARCSQPEKIAYPGRERIEGTLHLRINHSGIAPELQHLEPLVLERINGYFGFKAVARLKLIHGPLPKRPPVHEPVSRPLNETEERALVDDLVDVEDPDLRHALEGLGRAVMGRRANP